MLTIGCLENLKKIASSAHPKLHLADLGDDRLQEFYLEIADQFIPVGGHSCRFEKAKYLIWHIENLLPGVRADVTAFILRQWPQETEKKIDAAGSVTEEKNDQSSPAKPLASTRKISPEPEKQPPVLHPGPTFLQQKKQDWFDTLLNWMAILANLLPMKA